MKSRQFSSESGIRSQQHQRPRLTCHPHDRRVQRTQKPGDPTPDQNVVRRLNLETRDGSKSAAHVGHTWES